MAKASVDRNRYTNPVNQAVRSTAQTLLLKPAVWSLLKIQVHGLEHLDVLHNPRGFIVVGNHSSHFDAPLIIGALPSKLSKRLSAGAAADHFFEKWYVAASTSLFFNAFPVDRTGSRNKKGLASQLLSEGVPLLIFPEGTRSRTGGMGVFKPGAAALCISHNVPALPVALVGAHAAWPPGDKRWRPGRPEVHVVFGNPMMPHPGEIAHEFNERIRRAIMELHDTTATAYGMPTQAEFQHYLALPSKPSKPELG